MQTTNDILAAYKNTSLRATPRYSTAIKAIDDIFSQNGERGLAPGVYIVAGDPGTGKSTLLMQILEGMGIKGHPTLYLAFEGKENATSIIQRLGYASEPLLAPYVPAIMDIGDIRPRHEDICPLLRDLAAKNTTGKPLVVAIDSLKHVNGAEGNKGRRNAAIAINELSEELRRKGSGIIVLGIGHISAQSRGRNKAQKMLQGAAEWQELCDCPLILLDKTPEHRRLNGTNREVSISIDKNRWGQVGEFSGYLLTECGFVFPDQRRKK